MEWNPKSLFTLTARGQSRKVFLDRNSICSQSVSSILAWSELSEHCQNYILSLEHDLSSPPEGSNIKILGFNNQSGFYDIHSDSEESNYHMICLLKSDQCLYKLVMTVGVEQKMVLYESCTRMSAPPSNNHMLLVLPHHDRSPPLEIACDKMLLRRQKI